MAKNDHQRVQDSIKTNYGDAGNNLNGLRDQINPRQDYLDRNYQGAVAQNLDDYGRLSSGYNNLINAGPASNVNWQAYPGYQNFADTGGYSADDVNAIRARAIAPTRAIYANAQADLDRGQRLQGGYSPNRAAASAKMARQESQQIGDANINVEASLADAIRQGKLAGLSGMTGIDNSRMSENFGNRQSQLSALSGANSLYSSTPGLASSFGRDMFQGGQDQLQLQNLRQSLANNQVQGTMGMSQVPGNFQSVMGNISSVANLGGQLASAFMPGAGIIPKGGGGGSTAFNWGPFNYSK